MFWVMKKFLTIIILVFCLIAPLQANDIRDFKILGMSLGDSMLDYVSEKELMDNSQFLLPNKKFAAFAKVTPESKTYAGFQVYYLSKDRKYRIHRLGGMILYEDNIGACYKKKDEIVSELDKLFSNAKKSEVGLRKHEGDKSGKSTTTQVIYYFKSGDDVTVECYDWSKAMNMTDKLAVSITSAELRKHVDSGEAYKE